jgi:hypothetical protein
VLAAEIEVWRFRLRIERLRVACVKFQERDPMAGEIRESMAALRAAKQKMITDIKAEIASIANEVHATKSDALDALQLPRAELDATKQEIREIRQEFAPATNGGPPGPLPDTESSADSSGASAISGVPAKNLTHRAG